MHVGTCQVRLLQSWEYASQSKDHSLLCGPPLFKDAVKQGTLKAAPSTVVMVTKCNHEVKIHFWNQPVYIFISVVWFYIGVNWDWFAGSFSNRLQPGSHGNTLTFEANNSNSSKIQIQNKQTKKIRLKTQTDVVTLFQFSEPNICLYIYRISGYCEEIALAICPRCIWCRWLKAVWTLPQQANKPAVHRWHRASLHWALRAFLSQTFNHRGHSPLGLSWKGSCWPMKCTLTERQGFAHSELPPTTHWSLFL